MRGLGGLGGVDGGRRSGLVLNTHGDASFMSVEVGHHVPTHGSREMFPAVPTVRPGQPRGDQVAATRAARAASVPTGSVIAASTCAGVSATA